MLFYFSDCPSGCSMLISPQSIAVRHYCVST
jgi:hypothetical protein